MREILLDLFHVWRNWGTRASNTCLGCCLLLRALQCNSLSYSCYWNYLAQAFKALYTLIGSEVFSHPTSTFPFSSNYIPFSGELPHPSCWVAHQWPAWLFSGVEMWSSWLSNVLLLPWTKWLAHKVGYDPIRKNWSLFSSKFQYWVTRVVSTAWALLPCGKGLGISWHRELGEILDIRLPLAFQLDRPTITSLKFWDLDVSQNSEFSRWEKYSAEHPGVCSTYLYLDQGQYPRNPIH